MPSAVCGPVLAPPCVLPPPFGIAGDWRAFPLPVRAARPGQDCANGSVVLRCGRRRTWVTPMGAKMAAKLGVVPSPPILVGGLDCEADQAPG
jgi:hypothetical protein